MDLHPSHLDTFAAAEVLGVHHGTLANWRSAGIGPRYERVRGRIYYSRQAIRQWLTLHRRGTGKPLNEAHSSGSAHAC